MKTHFWCVIHLFEKKFFLLLFLWQCLRAHIPSERICGIFTSGHLNVQSLIPKLNELKIFNEHNKFDLLALSETWLNNSVDSGSIMISNFNVRRRDRNNGARGGGVLFYVNNRLQFEIIDVPNISNIEKLFIKIQYKGVSFVIGVVYKPPHI